MPPAIPQAQRIDLPDSDILYFPGFIGAKKAAQYFNEFRNNVPWRQDPIVVFGKKHLQPRLTALYGRNGKTYSYSGITMHPHPFTMKLAELCRTVEAASNGVFTTCLLNLYRDGNDSNGWHADNEKELGRNPVIASVSLGAVRSFHLRHRRHKQLKYTMELLPGSLLLMQGPTQHHWLHQVPKTKKAVGERINLTFRYIP